MRGPGPNFSPQGPPQGMRGPGPNYSPQGPPQPIFKGLNMPPQQGPPMHMQQHQGPKNQVPQHMNLPMFQGVPQQQGHQEAKPVYNLVEEPMTISVPSGANGGPSSGNDQSDDIMHSISDFIGSSDQNGRLNDVNGMT